MTFQLIVSGRVQGVGYRYYVQSLAEKYKIKGTVRNQSNGNVMIIAQTDYETLGQFISHLKIPQHRWMRIDNVNIEEIKLDKNYSDFRTIY
ncbi:acylphosphatase [Eremococcus coleocola]|uniref:acylphosphatase n=1 Tax=Eremococcus coleocola TaxID=88132 RepID=UPI0003FC13EB|nr:acylphosphatase [Eremococcus coleocola]